MTYGFVLGCGFGVEIVGVVSAVGAISVFSLRAMLLCTTFAEGNGTLSEAVPQIIAVATADAEVDAVPCTSFKQFASLPRELFESGAARIGDDGEDIGNAGGGVSGRLGIGKGAEPNGM